jgi:hypothetical protein
LEKWLKVSTLWMKSNQVTKSNQLKFLRISAEISKILFKKGDHFH